MKRLMLDHPFRFVDHVVFLIGPTNIRSQKAIEKLGASRIGNRVARGHEAFVYQITRT
jgi:RimJ/RimL family protein N-acetyltransferase